jgi:hypothetical protein
LLIALTEVHLRFTGYVNNQSLAQGSREFYAVAGNAKENSYMHVCFEPENYFLYKRLLEEVSAAYAHGVGGRFDTIAETAYTWQRQVPHVKKHFI